MMRAPIIDIISGPIEREAYGSPSASNFGAVVEFSGVVRDTEGGDPITGIEYEVFREMALAEMGRIAKEMMEKYELTDLVGIHRVGFVPIHEAAVYVRTAARHRQEAYEANIEFIERLKQSVPIWKHPLVMSSFEG